MLPALVSTSNGQQPGGPVDHRVSIHSAAAPRSSLTIEVAIRDIPGSPWHTSLHQAGKRIAEQTDRRVDITWTTTHPAHYEVFRRIQGNQVQGAVVAGANAALVDGLLAAMQLPGLITNADEFDYVRAQLQPEITARLSHRGLILVALGAAGVAHLYSTTAPSSVHAIRQTVIAVNPDDFANREYVRTLGGSVLPIASDAANPWKHGDTGAVIHDPRAVIDLTEYGYTLADPIHWSVAAVLITNTTWQQLSGADREVIQQTFKDLEPTLNKAVHHEQQSARELLLRSRVQVIIPSPMAARVMKAAAEATWQSLIGRLYSRTDLESVLYLRGKYRNRDRISH